MPSTRDFKKSTQKRIKADRVVRETLLREAVEDFLAGDLETGKEILRAFINATIGFARLSDVTRRPVKSLMRMLGPRGNPECRNLLEILQCLQEAEGVRFEVRPIRGAGRRRRAEFQNANLSGETSPQCTTARGPLAKHAVSESQQ